MNKAKPGDMVKWDGVKRVKLTARYIKALEETIRAKLEMMQGSMDPECWTWGQVTISDLACPDGITWEYGGEEDKPEDMKETVRGMVE